MERQASAVACRPLRAIAVVAVAACVFGLSYSLAGPLIAFDLERRGAGPFLVGANAAMHAAGVLAAAPVLPWATLRFGRRRLVLAGLAATAVLFALFTLLPGIVWWFALRFGLGVAAEAIFVLTESWASELSPPALRGRVMAGYTGVLSLGFAAGPGLLSLLPPLGPLPFLAGAAAALAAGLLLAAWSPPEPPLDTAAPRPLLRLVCLSPLAMGATLLNAAVETAGLSFLALYATGFGWPEPAATRLVTVLMLGAVLLQLPIGWLADRVDRRGLLIAFSSLAAIGAAAWPMLLHVPGLAYPALFIWGGVFVGIYTTMLAEIGARFSGADLIGLYGAMGVFWGGGALVGPLLAGAATNWTAHGLPLFAGAACAVFALGVAVAGRRRREPARL